LFELCLPVRFSCSLSAGAASPWNMKSIVLRW
jgi:hypothetical protein